MLLPKAVLATAQAPDHLIYEGETHALFSNPLEEYFNENNVRPKDIFSEGCISSACWRGYVALWEIKGKYLYLLKIEPCCEGGEIPISKIFPGRDAPIKATWFSGELRIPQGKELSYVHMGYGSVYEKDLILTIKNGRLIKKKTIDNTKKKISSERRRSFDELKKLMDWEEKNLTDEEINLESGAKKEK
jgi:hypothetical protein